MANANETTITVSFDPNSTSLQSDIIGPATSTRAGGMSAAQAAKLELLTPGTPGNSDVLTVTGTEAVAVGQIVEVDITYLVAHPADPLRYRVWRHTGGSPSAAGVARTACSGSGGSFTIQVGNLTPQVTMWGDGTASFHSGDPVGLSSLVDGGVVANGTPYLGTCISPTTITPVLGAAVPVWRNIL